MAKETDFNLWDSIFHTRKEQKTQPEEQKSVPKIVQPEKPEWLKQPPQPPKPRENVILEQARTKMAKNLRSEYEAAIKLLEEIPGWKDADQLLQSCKKALEERTTIEMTERRRQQTEDGRRRRKVTIGVTVILLVLLFLLGLWINSGIGRSEYGKALLLAEEGKCEQAVQLLESLEQKYGRNEDVKECIYKVASAFEDAGEYKWAYRLFDDLNQYKNSATRKKTVYNAFRNVLANQTKVGDILYCGEYTQQSSQNKEPIPWIVLEVKDGNVLLLSRDIINSRSFETRNTSADWGNSEVRNWTNLILYGGVFSQAQKDAHVKDTWVKADSNPQYAVNNGQRTTDKLFLLSAEEVVRYFPTAEQRKCTATPFAQECGAEKDSWMLRTMGKDGFHVTYVDAEGNIHYDGQPTNQLGGIRPAVWVDVSILIEDMLQT